MTAPKHWFWCNPIDRYVPLATEEQIFEYVLVKEVSFDPISENYDWTFFSNPNLEAYLYPHNALGAGLHGCLAVKIYLDQITRDTKPSISQPAARPGKIGAPRCGEVEFQQSVPMWPLLWR